MDSEQIGFLRETCDGDNDECDGMDDVVDDGTVDDHCEWYKCNLCNDVHDNNASVVVCKSYSWLAAKFNDFNECNEQNVLISIDCILLFATLSDVNLYIDVIGCSDVIWLS